MKDPKRIPIILERLRKVWGANPDLRLGQLFDSIIGEVDEDGLRYIDDLFWVEDDDLLTALEDFYYKPNEDGSKDPVPHPTGKWEEEG